MIRLQQLVGPRLPRVGEERQQLQARVIRTFLTNSGNSSRFPYKFPSTCGCRSCSLSDKKDSSRYAPASHWSSSGSCCRTWKGSTSSSLCGFRSSRHLTSRISSCSVGNESARSRTTVNSSSPRRRSDNVSRILSGKSSRSFSSGSSNWGLSKTLSWTSRDGDNSDCSVHAAGDTTSSSSYHASSLAVCVHRDSASYNSNSRKGWTDSSSSWDVADQAEPVAVGVELRACFAAKVSGGSSDSGRRTAAARGVALDCRVGGTTPTLNANLLCSRGEPCRFSCTGSSAHTYCSGGFSLTCFSRTCCSTSYASATRCSPSPAWFAAVAAGGVVDRVSSVASGLSPLIAMPSNGQARGRPPPQQQQQHLLQQHQQHLLQQQQQHLLQQQKKQQLHEPEQQQQHRSSSKATCATVPSGNSRHHERQLAPLGRPHLLGPPPNYPVQQMKAKGIFSFPRPSSLPPSSLPSAAAPCIPLLRPGGSPAVGRASRFSSTNSSNSSGVPGAERAESPGASRVLASPAAAQQQAAASSVSNAGTNSNVPQQTQRPQPPLQQPVQPQARSTVTTSSSFTRSRGAASSSSSKWWSFISVYGLCRLAFRVVSSLWGAFLRGMRVFFKYFRMILANPMVVKKFWKKGKESFSLFYANVRVSYQLLKKKILGHPLRYNEHKLLVRTTADALKLIPFSLMIVIPLGELLLPVMLRLFPNMLPSTFFEKQVDNAYLSRKLKAKQELAAFFQELVREHTKHIIEHESNDALKDKAKALREFQEKLLRKDQKDVNPFLSLKDILSFAKLFKEEFVLEKLDLQTLQFVPVHRVTDFVIEGVLCRIFSYGRFLLTSFDVEKWILARAQVMCKLLGIEPYSLQSHVILQLRYHLNNIQREDREFMWEGVETLSHEELVEACKDRAMMFHSISDEDMREQMRQWLEISSHKDIPPLLLLWCRCITLTHRPIAPPAVDLKSSSSAKAAAAGKAPAAATAAAGGGGGTAAGDGAVRSGAAAAPTAEAARSGEKEPGLVAAPAAPPSLTSPEAAAASLQQQQEQRQRLAEGAGSDQLLTHHQQEADQRFIAAYGGEQPQQGAPGARPAEDEAAAAGASKPAAQDRGTAATAHRQQEEGLGEKREEEEEAEDEEEKLKAATLEAMERQVELLRAEEETLRQSVLLLQEEEAQRKKMQAAEAAEALESESGEAVNTVPSFRCLLMLLRLLLCLAYLIRRLVLMPPDAAHAEHKAAGAGHAAEPSSVGEGSSPRDAGSTAERGEQQQHIRGRPAVFEEARDSSAVPTAAAPAAGAPAGASPGVDGEDDASLNELARVRSGREMLQRRARRMELELRLLRRLADMQHNQQEQAFGALSKVLQAAHACRVKQQALQQLVQLREQHDQQQEQQQLARSSTGQPQADEHLQQHLEAERGHHAELQRQQKQREAAPEAAAAIAAATDFPDTVTQLELCVEDVIRKFAEGVQQVEQLMRDAKRFQMNDNDPLFYPEDHSDMEDVSTLPASPSLAHAEQSHTVLVGPSSSSLSSSPPSPSLTSTAAGTYSAAPFVPSSDHALYQKLSGRREGGAGGERKAEKGAAPADSSSSSRCTALGAGSTDKAEATKKAAAHAGACI